MLAKLIQKELIAQHNLGRPVSDISALVVDDSPTSRTLLSRILNKKGIHCEQASSGEDALSQLSWFHPDYIFLDHLMPGLDGFETLAKIKSGESTKHIPVIMYTSEHAHNYYEEARRLGAAGVISKQIGRDKLYLMLDRLCAAKPSHGEPEVPTVFNEVRQTLNKTMESESSNAKLFARISTLEAAYEELLDEHRTLKMNFSTQMASQADKEARRSRFQLPQIVVTSFLALSLFASTFAWFTTQTTEQGLRTTQVQVQQINELIDEIIRLLEQTDPK